MIPSNVLSQLPFSEEGQTSFSISAENPGGGKGAGATAIPEPGNAAARLGKGWKVRPCIPISAGETVTLADIGGPGIIQHIWITVDPKAYRTMVLRIFWEEESSPAVEVPLGDFFANGHGVRCAVNSIPIVVNSSGGFNSYWQMPFQRRVRIEIENQWHDEFPHFFYQISGVKTKLDRSPLYFHGQWRRSTTKREHPEHVIVDSIEGRGIYTGTYLAWSQLSDQWWGEGEIKMYLDGDNEYPSICGTGTEDYFGGAWGFEDGTYSTAFLGYHQHDRTGAIPRHGMYRWHIIDPVHFSQNIRVTIQALGWWPDKTFQPLADDIASTAFFYLDSPVALNKSLPLIERRYPR